MKTVTIQPLTMRIFNSQGIYSPSKLRQQRTISYDEFLSQYAIYPIRMLVNFNPTTYDALEKNAVEITAYGFGLDCWYIVVKETGIEYWSLNFG